MFPLFKCKITWNYTSSFKPKAEFLYLLTDTSRIIPECLILSTWISKYNFKFCKFSYFWSILQGFSIDVWNAITSKFCAEALAMLKFSQTVPLIDFQTNSFPRFCQRPAPLSENWNNNLNFACFCNKLWKHCREITEF